MRVAVRVRIRIETRRTFVRLYFYFCQLIWHKLEYNAVRCICVIAFHDDYRVFAYIIVRIHINRFFDVPVVAVVNVIKADVYSSVKSGNFDGV